LTTIQVLFGSLLIRGMPTLGANSVLECQKMLHFTSNWSVFGYCWSRKSLIKFVIINRSFPREHLQFLSGIEKFPKISFTGIKEIHTGLCPPSFFSDACSWGFRKKKIADSFFMKCLRKYKELAFDGDLRNQLWVYCVKVLGGLCIEKRNEYMLTVL
jgi:hypothetical protein